MPINLKKSSLKYKDHEGNMQDLGLPVGGIITDITLTKLGVSADAKATGEKISHLEATVNDLKQNGTGTVVSNVEPLDDDIPKVYFTGALPTSKDEGDVPVSIHYKSKTEEFDHYATLKVQGGSSVNYAKKNFTLKMYEDEALENKVKRIFKNWGELNKWVLKAHWIDHSHVRNIGTAKIWSKIVESRSDYELLPEELRSSPNNGATDGFTVKVFVNGVYQGLYEWIVPKDKLFGQDSDIATHSIMNSELNNQPTCAFATTSPTISGNWSEELQDTMSSNISTSFENLIKFVAGSTDEEFVANAENYFDVQSVIDFDIFARVFCIVDNLCRNQIFFTYDGVKWYEGVWDVDAVLGLPPTTRGFFAYNTEFQTGYVAYKDYGVINLLYQRVETLFIDRFKERYSELRSSVLSVENILDVYERLMDVIKTYDGLLEEDFASTTGGGKFTGIPYTSENNIQQIRNFVAQRIPYMDAVIENIGNGDTPDVPDEPDTPVIANSFEESTWTSGYYNDNGVIEETLNLHKSQLIPIEDVLVGTSIATEDAYIRVVYFDENMEYVGYDRGAGLNVANFGKAPMVIAVDTSIGAYYAICANTSDKSKVTVGNSEEAVSLSLSSGKFINFQTGEVGENASSVACEEYMTVNAGEIYKFDCQSEYFKNLRIVFYDSNKSVINSVYDKTTLPYGFIIPDGCAYIRFSIFTTVANANVTTEDISLMKLT